MRPKRSAAIPMTGDSVYPLQLLHQLRLVPLPTAPLDVVFMGLQPGIIRQANVLKLSETLTVLALERADLLAHGFQLFFSNSLGVSLCAKTDDALPLGCG